MSTPYDYADVEIERLREAIDAEFHNAANEMPFDELNRVGAKTSVKALYTRLKSRSLKAFRRVAKKAYQAAIEEAGETVEGFSVEGFVSSLLLAFNPVTYYVYDNEVTRKRDRLYESVMASSTRSAMREAYRRAGRLWFGQARQYVDLSVDTARHEAFRQAGITQVRWVSQKDGRVCHSCGEYDEQIFSIDAVPDKPHRNCRCYTIPVRERF